MFIKDSLSFTGCYQKKKKEEDDDDEGLYGEEGRLFSRSLKRHTVFLSERVEISYIISISDKHFKHHWICMII